MSSFALLSDVRVDLPAASTDATTPRARMVRHLGVQFKTIVAEMVLAIGTFAATASADVWTVISLHPPEKGHSYALGVSGGQQAGYMGFASIGSSSFHASLWTGTASSVVDLNPAGSPRSYALGVGDGQQVGYAYLCCGLPWASLWSGSAASWINLNPAGATYSFALGVADGQQVGSADVNGQGHASLWSGSAASFVDLNPAGSVYSYAEGVSDGQQVGWADVNGQRRASLWSGTADSWVDLSPAGSSVSHAFGVGDGQQVGDVYFADQRHASLWSGSADSWVDLHPAGATYSYAYGVANGQQVGYATIDGQDYASLWSGTADSWVDLSAFLPADFSSSFARSIWSDENFTYVAGYGYNFVMSRVEALLWTQAACLKGDIDGNSTVNTADIAPMVEILLENLVPADTCPADTNNDGRLDARDIQSFTALLF